MRLLAGAAVTGTDGYRGCRLVAGDRRSLAGRDAEGVARPDGADADPGPAEGNLAPLSEGGRAMDASAVRAWPGRLPRRRHGARQDDPGLSLLLLAKRRTMVEMQPFLGGPASPLLANWAAEIERFAPGLTAKIVHPRR